MKRKNILTCFDGKIVETLQRVRVSSSGCKNSSNVFKYAKHLFEIEIIPTLTKHFKLLALYPDKAMPTETVYVFKCNRCNEGHEIKVFGDLDRQLKNIADRIGKWTKTFLK